MISFEELAQRFHIQNVAPYGACVVVPGAEFDPDWEVYLGEQGCRCRFTDLDGKPVTLVQRGAARSNQGEKEVYAPENDGGDKEGMGKNERIKALRKRAVGGNMWPRLWTVNEDNLLIALWDKVPKLTVAKISEQFRVKFPNRSPGSFSNHLWVLQQAGKIERRFSMKRKVVKAPKEEKVTEEAKRQDSDKGEKTAVPFFYTVEKDGDNNLRAILERIGDLEDTVDTLQKVADDLSAEIAAVKAVAEAWNKVLLKLKNDVARHKHAVSGEAMLPMEASA